MGPAGPEGSKVRLPTNRRASSTRGQNWSKKRLRALKTRFEHFLSEFWPYAKSTNFDPILDPWPWGRPAPELGGPKPPKMKKFQFAPIAATWGQNWSLKRLRALKKCFEHFRASSGHIQNRAKALGQYLQPRK